MINHEKFTHSLLSKVKSVYGKTLFLADIKVLEINLQNCAVLLPKDP